MRKMLKTASFVVVLCAVTAPAFAKATAKIINQSKWEIHHLFISPTTEEAWGPDQLGESVLSKGETLTVTDIPCDDYDVKVVDEDGDECVIEAVELCESHFWKITDAELLKCEGYE